MFPVSTHIAIPPHCPKPRSLITKTFSRQPRSQSLEKERRFCTLFIVMVSYGVLAFMGVETLSMY